MKKVLSLILAIVMIAMIVPASVITAGTTEDTKEMTVSGATNGAASWAAGDIATVTKKYFAVSFTMKAAKYAGITADNGCCGLMFGDNDDTCIFIPYDEPGADGKRGLGIWGGAKVMFGKWWGTSVFGAAANAPIDDYVDKYVTILALGTKNDDGTTTISVYVNGTKVHVWANQEDATAAFNGRLQWAIRLNNVTADIKFMQSDSPMLVIAPEGATIGCVDKKVTVPVNVVNNPGINMLNIRPTADGLKFSDVGVDEDEDYITDVFNDITVGINALFDAGNKNSKKLGKLAEFMFETTKSNTDDLKVALEVNESLNYDAENVPTFVVPAYVTLTHGEGKEIVDDSVLVSGATCTNKAVYNKTCDCGKVLADTFEAGELAPHTFTEKVDEKYLKTPASCASKAVYYKSCSVCGEKGTETFEAGAPTGEHNFAGEWQHDETNHWQNCGCGEEGPKTAHVYDNDCDTDCNTCGATRTITHNFVEKVVDEFLKTPATCATKAVYFKSCSVCGAKSEETFEAGETTDHTFGDWKHDNDKHWKECAGCGAKDAEAAHVYDNDCDTDCNTCGATRTITHNFVEKVVDEFLKTPATCATKAVYFKSCSVCGAKSEETFEAGETTDHTFGDWKHDNDKHWKECAGCGAKDAEAAHAYGEGVVTKEPTTTAEGEKTFTCECGATKTEKIDKLPEEVAPKTGSTTALIAAVALLSVTAGAAVVITRKKREI